MCNVQKVYCTLIGLVIRLAGGVGGGDPQIYESG
jgi:hypothetical protein